MGEDISWLTPVAVAPTLAFCGGWMGGIGGFLEEVMVSGLGAEFSFLGLLLIGLRKAK